MARAPVKWRQVSEVPHKPQDKYLYKFKILNDRWGRHVCLHACESCLTVEREEKEAQNIGTHEWNVVLVL